MKHRNHVFIAMRKRSGSGTHKKSWKQKRSQWKKEIE